MPYCSLRFFFSFLHFPSHPHLSIRRLYYSRCVCMCVLMESLTCPTARERSRSVCVYEEVLQLQTDLTQSRGSVKAAAAPETTRDEFLP